MKNTLVILGSHPRGTETFSFERDDCDIWVFNEALKQERMKRADAVFQMHLEAIWRNPNNRNDTWHYKWLSSGETPTIIMQDVYPDVPKSERYPLDEIISQHLGAFEWTSRNRTDNKYFSSTFCYALALGIHKGYKNIEVHGVEMETDTEYRYQRDGVTFWLGIAIGKGINVKAFCNIFDFPLYGYEGEATLHLEDITSRVDELTPILEEYKAEYAKAAAEAEQAVVLFLNENKDPSNVINTLREQVKAAYNMHVISGAIQENEKYKMKAEAMKEASGSFQFSRQEFEMAARAIGEQHQTTIQSATASAGACDALFKKAQIKNKERRRKALAEFAQVARKYISESMYVGLYQGAINENANYLAKLDNLIKAAGGEKSEAVLLAALSPLEVN